MAGGALIGAGAVLALGGVYVTVVRGRGGDPVTGVAVALRGERHEEIAMSQPSKRSTGIALALLRRALGCGGVTDTRGSPPATTPPRPPATDTGLRLHCPQRDPGVPGLASCEIAWRANWDNAWPASDCQGRIDQASLNVCFERINSTQCASFVDFLTTLGICGKANVCSTGVPTDGGGQ